MSDTVRKVALHTIIFPAKKKGEDRIEIKAGTEFECPTNELDYLEGNKAIRDPDTKTEVKTVSVGAKAKTQVDPNAARQEALVAKARDLGIKGIRANMSIETLNTKIDEALDAGKTSKAAAKAEDGDGDADVLG